MACDSRWKLPGWVENCPSRSRCAASSVPNETGGDVSVPRVRAGGSWLSADLDGYALEKIVVVDSRR
jgi:hypothetical protein